LILACGGLVALARRRWQRAWGGGSPNARRCWGEAAHRVPEYEPSQVRLAKGPRNFVSGRLCRIIAVASRGFMDEL